MADEGAAYVPTVTPVVDNQDTQGTTANDWATTPKSKILTTKRKHPVLPAERVVVTA